MIQEETAVNSNRRQNTLIFMCFLVYTISYISRYSYNSNQVAIISYYNTTKTIAGIVGTCYFIAYGAGQLFHGIMCRRYNKRIAISLALFVSSILNIILFFKPDFSIYKYLWFINGAMLSILWPSLISILSEKLDDSHLKKAVLVMATTSALGTAISYGTSALFNVFDRFEISFLIGFIFAIFMSVFWFVFYHRFSDTRVMVKQEEKKESSVSKTKNGRSGMIAMLVILGLFAVIDNFTKDGLSTWVPNILKEEYGLSNSLSIILTIVLPVIGVFGAAFSVSLNKKIKNYTLLCGLMFTMSFLFILIVIWMLKGSINQEIAIIIILISFSATSLLMHGINNTITSIAPLQLRKYFQSGKLAGILNACCYVGSAISSFGMGALADKFESWDYVFILIASAVGFATILSFICAIITRVKSKKTS